MEFLFLVLVLKLCVKFLPLFLFLLIVQAWSFCFLLMPINVLLQIEEGGLHLLATGCIKSTMLLLVYRVTSKEDCQRPPENRDGILSTHQDTAVSEGGGLQHPEECSSDNEDSMNTVSDEWEHCSEVNIPQELVVTVPNLPQKLNMQLMPSVVTLEYLHTQVSPLIVREVPSVRDIPSTTMQELPHDDSVRDQYGHDNSTPDDEEDERFATVDEAYSCNNYEVEELMLEGAVLRQSSEPDTKSDQEDKNELMPVVKEGHTVIESDNNFPPCVGSANNLDMKGVIEEDGNDSENKNQLIPSPSDST